MAALVVVLVVSVFMRMLMVVLSRLMTVLMPVMGMGTLPVAMLMLVLVFAVAAHPGLTSSGLL
jgi:hypothetical protein